VLFLLPLSSLLLLPPPLSRARVRPPPSSTAGSIPPLGLAAVDRSRSIGGGGRGASRSRGRRASREHGRSPRRPSPPSRSSLAACSSSPPRPPPADEKSWPQRRPSKGVTNTCRREELASSTPSASAPSFDFGFLNTFRFCSLLRFTDPSIPSNYHPSIPSNCHPASTRCIASLYL
jgi:hypothetical protein